MARRLVSSRFKIRASAIATDSIALHDRRDLLVCKARRSARHKAYSQAGLGPQDIDLFGVHDAFTIMSALSLEACGFAERGKGAQPWIGWRHCHRRRIQSRPWGGLKARGHPVGATGMYQVVEVVDNARAGGKKESCPMRGLAWRRTLAAAARRL